eukprot:CAMPEP_0197261756 /NCGR_PEP_ID=MMETSP1432-20130617/139_1 /TAXON_ID=44447 /ORGANISM="Pseudo-nitzschia delicatissima, Strain UNC1205" /LENGTH=373 /DNA_ID=CAMNT_0042726041 /DNA_START=93 /DNA_END=1214 /DNA_ORIENTATION=-
MTSTSLSEDSVHQAIDKVLAASESSDVLLRRADMSKEQNSMLSLLDPTNQNDGNLRARTPFYFGIQAMSRENVLVGFCTFYIAYSTWDGRMLYADQIHPEKYGRLLFYRIMAKIATEIGCSRFTWKQKDPPEWNIDMANPEYLDDWIFLSMDRVAMANFVGSIIPSTTTDEEKNDMSLKSMMFLHIEDTIREILFEQSMKRDGMTVNLKLAESDDTDTIAGLVKGLAIYEKEPDAVNVTAKDYFVDGYNSTDPLFHCILVDVTDEKLPETITTVAMGLFYFGHDLKEGPFLYLEDLYCEEAFRKKGIGTEIMKVLAHISLTLDCSKFVWTALDWNAPALAFYKKIGATMQTELKITRYCGSDVEAFAQSDDKT